MRKNKSFAFFKKYFSLLCFFENDSTRFFSLLVIGALGRCSLLLGSVLLFIRLLLGLDQTEVVEALVGAGLSQRLVGGELGLFLCDGARSFGLNDLGDGDDVLGQHLRGDIHLLLRGITLMRLGKLLGEEDEFGSVLLEALDILLKRLDAFVAATVIDGDSDRPGEVLVEAGGFDLLQSESATESLLLVVLNRRAPDDGSELGGGPGSDFGCEGLSRVLPPDLPRRLVEPRLHAVLPILLEVGVLNHVVVLGSHFRLFLKIQL